MTHSIISLFTIFEYFCSASTDQFYIKLNLFFFFNRKVMPCYCVHFGHEQSVRLHIFSSHFFSYSVCFLCFCDTGLFFCQTWVNCFYANKVQSISQILFLGLTLFFSLLIFPLVPCPILKKIIKKY